MSEFFPSILATQIIVMDVLENLNVSANVLYPAVAGIYSDCCSISQYTKEDEVSPIYPSRSLLKLKCLLPLLTPSRWLVSCYAMRNTG